MVKEIGHAVIIYRKECIERPSSTDLRFSVGVHIAADVADASRSAVRIATVLT